MTEGVAGGLSSWRDGPAKHAIEGFVAPIRIWSRTGRRPLLAAGNSNGDGRTVPRWRGSKESL